MVIYTAKKTIEVLKSVFAIFNFSKCLVFDNEPRFSSWEFSESMAESDVLHVKSDPYHPATNGAAEHFVQIFKQVLWLWKWDTRSLQQKLAQFLIWYTKTHPRPLLELHLLSCFWAEDFVLSLMSCIRARIFSKKSKLI